MTRITAESRVLVLGASGMVGSAVVRMLRALGCQPITPASDKWNMTRTSHVAELFEICEPEYVFVCAGLVGGIKANRDRPASFGAINAQIAANTLDMAANTQSVKKLLYLGSSCMYPRDTDQPMREQSLHAARLEPTNEMYALAKHLGVKLCDAYRQQYGCNFISAIPCNLFGPNDNYDKDGSHVVAAMIRRFHEAKASGADAVQCWGTGMAVREFMHVDDLANACLHLMDNYDQPGPINVGVGKGCTIAHLAAVVADVVDYRGKILWGDSNDDGMPVKVMDCARVHDLGWTHTMSLQEGIVDAYDWYLANAEGATV